MKQSKMCSGRGFDSRPVHHKHVRYTHSIQRHQKRERAFDGSVLGFDRANSSDMDDPTQRVVNSKKAINANDAFFEDYRLAA